MMSAGRRVTVDADLKSVWVVGGLRTAAWNTASVHTIRSVSVFHFRTGYVRIDGAVRVQLCQDVYKT